MKKLILTSLILSSFSAVAQNVGINSTGATPVTSAALDVDMANKGVLIPRVALTTTSAFAPVTGTATVSLLVFNTATAGTFPTNVTPGYYYWSGSAWVRLINSGTQWELLGNQGTTMGTNFLGTLDNVGLDLRTNNTLRQRILNSGETVFNDPVPYSGDIVSSFASGNNSALNAYLDGTGAGYAIYTENLSTNVNSSAINAFSTGPGYNIYAHNSNTSNLTPNITSVSNTLNGNGIVSFVGTGGTYTIYSGGASGTFVHPEVGVYGVAGSNTTSTGGVFASKGATPMVLVNGSGLSVTSTQVGVSSSATSTNSFGGYFSGNNSPFVVPATGGAGIAVNSSVIATWSASSGTANDTWGGFF